MWYINARKDTKRTFGYLKESTSQEQWKIWHEGHQEGGESGEKEDGRHEAEFHAAAGEVLGEDVAGEDASDEEPGEAEGPHQVDGGCVRRQVVGEVWLHWPCFRLWVRCNVLECLVHMATPCALAC